MYVLRIIYLFSIMLFAKRRVYVLQVTCYQQKFIKLIILSEICCYISSRYIDVVLSYFCACTKAICPRCKIKKKYIYEFISQRNCDVSRIISNVLRHLRGIRDETFAVRTPSANRGSLYRFEVRKLQWAGGLRASTRMVRT